MERVSGPSRTDRILEIIDSGLQHSDEVGLSLDNGRCWRCQREFPVEGSTAGLCGSCLEVLQSEATPAPEPGPDPPAPPTPSPLRAGATETCRQFQENLARLAEIRRESLTSPLALPALPGRPRALMPPADIEDRGYLG